MVCVFRQIKFMFDYKPQGRRKICSWRLGGPKGRKRKKHLTQSYLESRKMDRSKILYYSSKKSFFSVARGCLLRHTEYL